MAEPSTDPRLSSFDIGADFKRAITVAHTRLDDYIEREIATLGLTIGEADVLTVVLVAGDESPAPSDLADWLSLTTAGTTGRLNTLEQKGLIERQPHPSDGRRLTIHLTETGNRLAATVLKAKDESLTAFLKKKVGAKRTRELVAELDAVVQHLMDALAPPPG